MRAGPAGRSTTGSDAPAGAAADAVDTCGAGRGPWGLEGVTVAGGDRPALADIDLELVPGRVVAAVGGDGAGKSTLCRVLAGLQRVDSGRVRTPPVVGYQPDGSGVWGDLTVSENLELVASAHRLRGADARARIDELLERTRLTAAADRRADALSGGMRQKLGVAAAVLPRPPLLVLDEPTTGLDPVSRGELAALIGRFVADGMAVLSTTTYVDEAETADRILALDAGRVLAAGGVDDILAALPGALAEPVNPAEPVDPAEPADPGGAPEPPPLPGEGGRWRRGHRWRIWFPDGRIPVGARPHPPDLTDVMTVAALAAERAGR